MQVPEFPPTTILLSTLLLTLLVAFFGKEK
jgi:hypothetical protein